MSYAISEPFQHFFFGESPGENLPDLLNKIKKITKQQVVDMKIQLHLPVWSSQQPSEPYSKYEILKVK